VDGVNDDWHARTRGGQTTQHASLATVGVDDVRTPLAKQEREALQRRPVFPRMHRANQVRHESQEFRRFVED